MRIIYGIAGEGLGHATRSKVVIEHLEKRHEVIIFCGGAAYQFLKGKLNVKHIECFRIKFKNFKLNKISTLLQGIVQFPHMLKYNTKLNLIIRDFNPDLIITDFEPFTAYLAKLHNIPLISIDNQRLLTNTNVNTENIFDRIIKVIGIYVYIPRPDYSIITTFFYPKIKSRNTFLVPPILRKNILKIKKSSKNHILVYLSIRDVRYMKLLNKLNESFIVYGLNKNYKKGNLVLKKSNEKSFINDLASSKAVITNAGASTIGEALYFKKPILAIPIENHFEQIINAQYVEKEGYGKYSKILNEDELLYFLKNQKKYNNNLKKYKAQNNDKLFKLVDKIISKL